MPFYGHANPDVLLDTSSQLMKGASVSVYLAGTTTLATIYSTRTGTVKANPFTTNAASGTYDFYAVPGNYDLSVGGSTVGTVTVWPEPNRGDSGYRVRGGGSAAADTAELQQAMNDASADGGRTVMLPQFIQLNAQLVVPDGCDIRGDGGLPRTQSPSRVLLTAAGAGISWGTATAGSGGGLSGGFQLDGQNLATLPAFVGVGTRTYRNIEILNSAGDGILLSATQNSLFEELNVSNCAGDNIVFDKGAGGNHLLKCESNQFGRSAIAFRATGVGGGGVAYPLANTIENTICEYVKSSSGPVIYHGAGLGNWLVGCNIVADAALTAMATRSLIRVAQDYTISGTPQISQLRVSDSNVQTTVADLTLRAFDVGSGATLFVGGNTAAPGMGYLFGAVSGATIEEYGYIIFTPSSGGRRYFDAASQGATRRTLESNTNFFARATGDPMAQVFIAGETYPRWATYGNGYTWYSNGAAGPDVNWYRTGAGVVGTDYCTRTGVGATAARPTGVPAGAQWYDTTLGKPIWWSGSNWRDAAGTVV